MKNGNKAGLIAVVNVIASAVSAYLFNRAFITFSFLVLAFGLSIAAGVLRPRAWFVLTGLITLLFVTFSVFVGVMWSIGKSGI